MILGQINMASGKDVVHVMQQRHWVMCEKSLENNNKVHVCYVDFEKAFDRISWVKLVAILTDIEVDWRDRNLIK